MAKSHVKITIKSVFGVSVNPCIRSPEPFNVHRMNRNDNWPEFIVSTSNYNFIRLWHCVLRAHAPALHCESNSNSAISIRTASRHSDTHTHTYKVSLVYFGKVETNAVILIALHDDCFQCCVVANKNQLHFLWQQFFSVGCFSNTIENIYKGIEWRARPLLVAECVRLFVLIELSWIHFRF